MQYTNVDHGLVVKLARSVSALDLPERLQYYLRNAGIRFICELVGKTKADMLNISGFGPRSIQKVNRVLAAEGLKLSMRINDATFRAVQAEIVVRDEIARWEATGM